MSVLPASFHAGELSLELRDPQAFPLVRLCNQARAGGPGGEWESPAPQYRTLRVDPPADRQDAFAVLYTADTLPCVAAECRLLQVNQAKDIYSVDRGRLCEYLVTRYAFKRPGLFIRIDADHAEPLGLHPRARGTHMSLRDPYAPYQAVSLALFERFGGVAHGLSWQSMHRNQLGRVYAIWHERKPDLGLEVVETGGRLDQDSEWLAFERANPGLPDVPRPGSDP